jgi:hypothetical protein
MLVSKTIPNLINGVSQQPDSLRFASQCEAQENAYPSVVGGLTKRLPTEHLMNTGVTGDSPTFTHIINRDAAERYVLIIRNEEIRIFDLINLNEETVDTPDGTSYLNTNDADTALKVVTIADVTFIVNTEITVNMASDSTPGSVNTNEALIFIEQGTNEDTTDAYQVTVDDGTTETTVGTGTATAGDLADTSVVATRLADNITAISSDWTATVDGHIIYVKNTANDFTITSKFKHGSNYISSFKDSTQRFADLPTFAKDGLILKVESDPTETVDDYYVKFATKAAVGEIGEGIWEECAAPDLASGLKFVESTMPHVLIRQPDSTFVFKEADGSDHDGNDYSNFGWANRLVGDLDTNPNPTFVGSTINDIFLFKNRLGLLSSDNVSFSESGEFFNFFRTTVVDLIDTAPIDVASAHNEVSIFRHAVPFVDKLVLFTDTSQFILEGAPILSPKTVSLTYSTSFEGLKNCSPTVSGTSLLFAFDRGSFSGLREYFPKDMVENLFQAADITAHVPRYIPGKITQISAATHENVVVCRSDEDTDALYIYNHHDSGGERLQSAWHRFGFGAGSKILGVDFIDTNLYMVVYRAQGVFIEKLAFEIGKTDPGTSHVSHLDRRTGAATIDDTGKIITLPYEITEGRTNLEVITATGVRVPLTSTPSVGDTTVTLRDSMRDDADHGSLLETPSTTDDYGTLVSATLSVDNGSISSAISALSFWAGEAYEMVYQLSDVTLKENSPGGGRAVITDGRAQLRYGTLVYADSTYFSVEVTPNHRDTSTHTFAGRVLGSALTVGEVPLESGEFRFPVFSKANQVTITIKNDSPLPSNLMSAEFELNWSPRAKRIGV